MITQRHTTRSQAAFAEAQQLMPGGVNSPVRAFRSVGGSPVFFARAQGARLWDIDDNSYLDYVGSWGPAILGHAFAPTIEAICQAAPLGTSFGAPTLLETQMAQAVIDRVPSIEKVRFVNSGTEAVMSALRLARAFTGRPIIIKFAGCYHGHTDALLVKAGSGATTLGIPDSAGVPGSMTQNTLIAQFNNLASVQALLEGHPGQVAGILVEPVAGNMGCVVPQPGFLEGLRALADAHGALLMFDEVMTGFRLAPGGAQERYGVLPDVTTLGKIIGGGLPVGAYGGRKDIMAMVAPEGPMYQAGTLSGNPVAMAAGLATLQALTPEVYADLDAKGTFLAEGLREIFAGEPVCVTQVGSMVTVFFTPGPVVDYDTALQADRERFQRFFHAMLEQGVYLPPSQFEAWFLSAAHTQADLEATLTAARQSR